MKRSVGLWQLWGFAITSLGGTLLHYLYDWTNSVLAAPFSGVNESTWEHMKLLFWPMLLFAVVQSFFFKDRRDFWCIKLKGTLLGITLIPLAFYTYNGVIGPSPTYFNILLFFVAAAIAYLFEARLLKKESTRCASPRSALILLCVIAALFTVFTFATPELGIFRDPLSGGYGI